MNTPQRVRTFPRHYTALTHFSGNFSTESQTNLVDCQETESKKLPHTPESNTHDLVFQRKHVGFLLVITPEQAESSASEAAV